MGLHELNLKVMTMDSSEYDLIGDFFIPALEQSIYYDRGVGYFSSGWIRIAARGLLSIAKKGGRVRWVISPILSDTDWQALKRGEEAKIDPSIYQSLIRSIEELEKDLQQDTLSALAWMVADGILDFRIALPRGKLEGGEFHDKFGIFTDSEGDQISFNGSYNDSIHGTLNYESIKIFPSWVNGFSEIVKADAERFEKLWQNEDPNLRVFTIPESAREQIIKLKKGPRPYPAPLKRPFAPPGWVKIIDFQTEAVESWFKNGNKGILEMATGTGKTIVALRAICRHLREHGKAFIVVTCPFKHLVEQWAKDCRSFNFDPITCYGARQSWEDELNNKIVEYNHGIRDAVFVITTHATFSQGPMQKTIERIEGDKTILVADEVHHFGAKEYRNALPKNMSARLGLSATPERWYDPEGTAVLKDYFGEIVFSFPLKRAIEEGYLCPYEYYPHVVELTEDEIQEYINLTKAVGRVIAAIGYDEEDERLVRLLNKRADVLNKAENKLKVIKELIKSEDVHHALFYCAPGQINEVLKILGGEDLRVCSFIDDTPVPKRIELLSDLADGKWMRPLSKQRIF
jgi:superfamily II DNA or RNA helicase